MADNNPAKSPTSVNLREDHKSWMDSENINRSKLINDLITEYRNSRGVESDAVKRLRAQQLETELESTRSKASLLEDELESVKQDITSPDEKREAKWDETMSKLTFNHLNIGGWHIVEGDEFVADLAAEHDMDVEAFRDAAIQRWEDRQE